MLNRFFPTIVLVNVDTDISDAELTEAASALQQQVTHHFCSVWNVAASVTTALVHKPTDDDIEVRLLKQPTMDGALGYHDEKDNGTPIAYIFEELCKQNGTSWTSCASHEILELLGDPYLRACVQMDDGSIWDMEVCDRVEADTYKIGNVEVSNFNTPAAFMPPKSFKGARFDWLGLSTRPNEVRPGGYAQKFDPSAGWQQVGEMRPYRKALAALGLGRGHRRAHKHKHHVQP